MMINKDIPPITDYPQAKQYLFYLLSRREYSRYELAQKLDARLCPAEIKTDLLNEFIQNDWQSDYRFSVSLVKSKAASGYGVKMIQQLLNRHQIKLDMTQLEADAEIDWFDSITQCYEKKYRNKPVKDFKDKQKRYRYLYSRGYSSDLIQSIV